jgi:chorismate mutase
MTSNRLKFNRNKIDLLDKKILNLIKKRTQIVKHMLSLKKNKKDIVDHKRIKIMLKNIRKKSIQKKIDPSITVKIWKSMIWAYVDFQRKNFKKK